MRSALRVASIWFLFGCSCQTAIESDPTTLSSEDAAALLVVCEPIVESTSRGAWSREELKIDLDDGISLSDADLAEILKLAADAGLHEPVALFAGRTIQVGWRFQVVLTERATEDPRRRRRHYRSLAITCPQWREVDYSNFVPAGNGGGWELDWEDPVKSSPWHEYSLWFVRNGEHVWEFSTSESVTYDLALELLLVDARREYEVDLHPSSLESASDLPRRRNGDLGRVAEKFDLVHHMSPRPDPADYPWTFRIELRRGYSGDTREFTLRDGKWVLVRISGWIG